MGNMPFYVESNMQTNLSTSIKLIMNPSKVHIALKKKLSDKTMICSTFRVLLNEIYWMANDTQLKSAIGTYSLISKLMKKAFEQRCKYMKYDQKQSKNVNSNSKNETLLTHNFTNIRSELTNTNLLSNHMNLTYFVNMTLKKHLCI